MNKESLNKLFKECDKIQFYESTHSYFYKPTKQKFKYSVTQYSSKFKEPFNSDYWSERKAKELNMSKQEVLDMWDKKAKVSNTIGTLFHEYIHIYLTKNKEDLKIKEILKDLNLIGKFHNFNNDFKNRLIPIKSEFVIGDTELDLAGTIDQLYWSNVKKSFVIFDWKTNSKISFDNQYQKLLPPFQDYDDCTFNHFKLQLMMYKYMIEKISDIKIDGLYINWFNRFYKNYKIINIWDEKFYEIVKSLFVKDQEF